MADTLTNAGVPGADGKTTVAATTDTKTDTATTTTTATDTTATDTTKATDTIVNKDAKVVDTTATTTTATDAAKATTEDWRVTLAGGDEKELERLKRFTDQKAVWKSYRALEQKLSAGEIRPGLAKDATPEQVADYRKAHGIPETPDQYLKDIAPGIVMGEEDKILFSDFAKAMHEVNTTPEVFKQATKWYYDFYEKQQAETNKKDSDFRRESENVLRADWQKDYDENATRAGEVLSLAPDSIRENIQNARLPDGSILGNHPDFAKWLAAQSRELNPIRTAVPNGVVGQIGSVHDEIKNIEKLISDPARSKEYWKDEKMQSRYRDLLDYRTKLEAKGKAA